MANKSFFKYILTIVLIVLFIRLFIIDSNYITSGSMIPTLLTGDRIISLNFTYGINIPFTNTRILNIKKPKRGEIIIFYPPDKKNIKKNGFNIYPQSDEKFIKRVIALSGDKIKIINNNIYINNIPLKRTKKGINSFQDTVNKHKTDFNAYLYKEKIGKYEVNTIEIIPYPPNAENFGLNKYNKITYDKEQIKKPYTVPENTVFVIGDNRGDSEDSRFFGPVPLNNITGSPYIKWFEKNKGFTFSFIK